MVTLAASLKRSAVRAIAALLFAVVALHATLPVGAPLERSAGSAFSASTADVALGCTSRSVSERKALPDQSAPTIPQDCAVSAEPLAVSDPAAAPARTYDAQAPPAFLALVPQSGPRAPRAA